MKLIFLDVDGVLNNLDTFKRSRKIFEEEGILIDQLEEELIANLKEIVDATDAKIILSSSWRIFFKKQHGKVVPKNEKALGLVNMLKKYDLEIYDMTTLSYFGLREIQIMSYLIKHKNFESFVILDDNVDFLDKLLPNLVLTKRNDSEEDMGLTKEDVNSAINILNNMCRKRKK